MKKSLIFKILYLFLVLTVVAGASVLATNTYLASQVSYGNSNVEDALNGLYKLKENTYNYANNEQVIGKWVNGKPIYRKIWTNVTVSNGTQLGTIATVETIIDSDTVVIGENQGDGYWNNAHGVSCSINPTTGIVSTNVSGWTTINVTCKLEYTKTTDNPTNN